MIERLEESGVLQSLPRRKKHLNETSAFVNPPMLHFVTFKARWYHVLGRLFMWLYAAFYYYVGLLWDKVRGRDRSQRRAERLRKTFEMMGGTSVKLGQQLASRVDLLPYVYCRELSKLLDEMKPFPFKHAVAAVERAAGKPLAETFSAFDPEPIGSASIACVYQARLHDGQLVAVKVRRPGIGVLFAADLDAIDLVGRFLELMTLLNPGVSAQFRKVVRETLLEEMDFVREARFQELFRRQHKKAKRHYLTAPRVYPDLSSYDVLIMDLVTSGLRLTEVLAAVEQDDERTLALMRDLNIVPKRVAKRLLWANYAGMVSELFFHSDPHPANVFVQADSKLVFIDFGSCGAFSQAQRNAIEHINYHQYRDDAQGMARASLDLLEPLPSINADALAQELEELYRLSLYALRSNNAQWWERTTAVQWFLFVRVVIAYRIPLSSVILRMIRATLLYDTLAARLDPAINYHDEYRRFQRKAGKLAHKRLKKRVRKTLKKGFDESLYLRLEEAVDTGHRLVFELKQFLATPPAQFNVEIKKPFFILMTLFKVTLTLAVVTGLIVLVIAGGTAFGSFPAPIDVVGIMRAVVNNTWYQLWVVLVGIINIRRILSRLAEPDVQRWA